MGHTRRPLLVLGTAGHIDHGKTSLIRALTGVDTDRLPEEKSRGITIELGFAPLDLPGGLRLGVVDVPGHEGLVRTMVAGAAGIDLVLLVVAADEGVMPQTREHLAICDLLGLELGVVALTKVDLVDEEMVELASLEVADLVASTCLGRAPIVPVSATTGAGLDALRDTLTELAARARARTPRVGPARLWVDRRFEMRGFGSVATGTLIGDALRVGDEIELLPGGRRGRVRGLQSFGVASQSVAPGARCAVNLQGVPLDALSRGTLLARPDSLAPTRRFDAELHWLPAAPALGREPTAVELLCGTAERRARVAPIGAEAVAPGERALVRIHVDGELLGLLPGDRFVLRGFHRSEGSGATLGGGRVLDVAPLQRRRSDPGLVADLRRMAAGDRVEAVRTRVERAGFAGMRTESLARELGVRRDEVTALLRAETPELLELAPDLWLALAPAEQLEGRLLAALEAFHRAHALEPGMPRATLRGALPENVPPAAFEHLLERLAAQGRIEAEEKHVRARDFVPRLTPLQERLATRLRERARNAGLEPPTLAEWCAELELAESELRALLAHLEREGALVHAPGDLWFDRAAVDALRERVVRHLTAEHELPTPAYKELIGTTRKYAVPLMELFDAEHLTIRHGEARRLRRRP